jgi:ubiquinone/menaquinone biosynthesis C-methylase UbiE
MDFFEKEKLTALEAKEKAQWIAFAPVVFQSARILRDSGILNEVEINQGLTLVEIVERVKLPHYGVRVLVEAALGMGLLTFRDEKYFTTKTATFLLHDKLTRVNMDFIHDVCYQGMFHLDESIKTGKPEGLKVFGEWSTIYEGLSKLPAQVQKSWFGFDHFYSDYAFPDVLPYIFENKKVESLLDIGGNTGKWALQCFEFDPDVEVTIMDLPGQVEMAKEQIISKGFGNRIHFFETNLLNEQLPFPKGFDAIWMSQFLDCFSDEQIKSILRRCHQALNPEGCVYILEPFWNRQRFQASAFALQQTSLYFTAMANGNSQMYHSENFVGFVKEAGFKVEEQKNLVGVSHTLLKCIPVS